MRQAVVSGKPAAVSVRACAAPHVKRAHHRQVVAVAPRKFGARRQDGTALLRVHDGWQWAEGGALRQGSGDGEHGVHAAQHGAHDEHLCQPHIYRQQRQVVPQRRQLHAVVAATAAAAAATNRRHQCAQLRELRHGRCHGGGRRRVQQRRHEGGHAAQAQQLHLQAQVHERRAVNLWRG